uniref:Uncharacterized protein n=1 Tax=Romanomermis culicivorax TaxID=13658 RepID=A0A915JK52_ROMCU
MIDSFCNGLFMRGSLDRTVAAILHALRCRMTLCGTKEQNKRRKIYGENVDHVSRAYDEFQKALFHQTDIIQDVGISAVATAHDCVIVDTTHDHKIETTVEHHHEKIGTEISPPSDLLIQSRMISSFQNSGVEALVPPMTSNIEVDIVDGNLSFLISSYVNYRVELESDIEKSKQRHSEINQSHSPQLVTEEYPADLFLPEQPAIISDQHISHIQHEEQCELTSHLTEAETSQPPDVTVPAVEERFAMHEFEEPEATISEELVRTKTAEPSENMPPEPVVSEKHQSTFEGVEVLEAKIPEPLVESFKEKIELHKNLVEKNATLESAIKPTEAKAKVEVAKPSAKAPEVLVSKLKSTHAPKPLSTAKAEEKKKPEPTLDARMPALDKTKKVPSASPTTPKALSTVSKQTATTPKPAATAALKSAKATPELKAATPKATSIKPMPPMTPAASLGRRTQSHSPARPPPPPALAAQSRRDNKPKASEIFAERKKKREEEHSSKKKGTAAAAPTMTSNDDKTQQEKERRRKEAEAAFQSWLQRKEQERKRARSTGRPVDTLHNKDVKDAANKRRDDAQAAFLDMNSSAIREKNKNPALITDLLMPDASKVENPDRDKIVCPG